MFTLKPLEPLETKVVDLLLKRRTFLRALTIKINQNYTTQKFSTFSEHLYSNEKPTATIILYCSEKTTATFVSSQIDDRWVGK